MLATSVDTSASDAKNIDENQMHIIVINFTWRFITLY